MQKMGGKKTVEELIMATVFKNHSHSPSFIQHMYTFCFPNHYRTGSGKKGALSHEKIENQNTKYLTFFRKLK